MEEVSIPLYDLAMCLSRTTDLVSSLVSEHQERVGYIASGIAMELGLEPEAQAEVAMAGALHDIGAMSLSERIDCLEFDVQTPHRHAEAGFRLLREFPPFAPLAELVRHHHLPWEDGRGEQRDGQAVPLGSHILHLADRFEVLLDRHRPVTEQLGPMREALQQQADRLFQPRLVEALLALTGKEYFWFDLTSPSLRTVLGHRCGVLSVSVGEAERNALARMFGHAIDFRSRFTAVHSSGVAVTARALAELADMSAAECRLMEAAGFMHDFGKLALPRELLEKTGPLNVVEYAKVKAHPYHAHRLLETIPALRTLNLWISFHHERPDGTGYPFRIGGDRLPLGARIMAVADVFTATSEDRPYRRGMSSGTSLGLMREMAAVSALDGSLIELLQRNFGDINQLRLDAQQEALRYYHEFCSEFAS